MGIMTYIDVEQLVLQDEFLDQLQFCLVYQVNPFTYFRDKYEWSGGWHYFCIVLGNILRRVDDYVLHGTNDATPVGII